VVSSPDTRIIVAHDLRREVQVVRASILRGEGDAGRDTSGVAGKRRNVLAKVVFGGAASIASAASASIVSAGEPADAILKIYATQLVSDYKAPWRPGVTRTVCGSGSSARVVAS
jgi:hypothetical protein